MVVLGFSVWRLLALVMLLDPNILSFCSLDKLINFSLGFVVGNFCLLVLVSCYRIFDCCNGGIMLHLFRERMIEC